MLTPDINQVLNNNHNHVNALVTSLKRNGYCFVNINHLKGNTETVLQHCKGIFSAPDSKLRLTQDLGYFDNKNKQHLRLVTGNYNRPEFKQGHILRQFCLDMDGLVRILTAILNGKLFHHTQHDVKRLSLFSNYHAGMIDIVKYNKRPQGAILVDEHVDPGLFSLNVFSSAQRMEFRDHLGNWQKLPDDLGVIFLGQAAHDMCGLPAARHRVVSNGQERWTIWYELCINEQIPPKHKIKDRDQAHTKARKFAPKKSIDIYTEKGLEKLEVEPDESALKAIERTFGIPTTKILKPGDDDGFDWMMQKKVPSIDIRGGQLKRS